MLLLRSSAILSITAMRNGRLSMALRNRAAQAVCGARNLPVVSPLSDSAGRSRQAAVADQCDPAA
jgi:hypothetical protein